MDNSQSLPVTSIRKYQRPIFQNHRRLITSALVSEPPPGPQVGHLWARFGLGIPSPHAAPKRVAPGDSRARPPCDTFRISDSQVFGLSLNPAWSRVVGGLWFGPFLGRFFTESSDLDLDHAIRLEWADVHGAGDGRQSRNSYSRMTTRI
jgi:hypothetical protein